MPYPPFLKEIEPGIFHGKSPYLQKRTDLEPGKRKEERYFFSLDGATSTTEYVKAGVIVEQDAVGMFVQDCLKGYTGLEDWQLRDKELQVTHRVFRAFEGKVERHDNFWMYRLKPDLTLEQLKDGHIEFQLACSMKKTWDDLCNMMLHKRKFPDIKAALRFYKERNGTLQSSPRIDLLDTGCRFDDGRMSA